MVAPAEQGDLCCQTFERWHAAVSFPAAAIACALAWVSRLPDPGSDALGRVFLWIFYTGPLIVVSIGIGLLGCVDALRAIRHGSSIAKPRGVLTIALVLAIPPLVLVDAPRA